MNVALDQSKDTTPGETGLYANPAAATIDDFQTLAKLTPCNHSGVAIAKLELANVAA